MKNLENNETLGIFPEGTRKGLEKGVKPKETNTQKRKFSQEIIKYLMKKHEVCLKYLEDK